MDTVSWILVVVVGGLALLACFLAGTLIAKRSRAAAATAPAGGATTPRVPTMWEQAKTFVETHWDKIGGTAAALFAVFMVIYVFNWMPKLAAAYYDKYHGLGYWLLVPVATFILPALIWPGRVRKILLWTLGILLGGLILPALLPAIWEVAWGPPSASASVQTAYATTCDRKIHENVLVTSTPLEINRDPHHCGVRWLVTKGAMQPLGPMVTFGEQRLANASGDTRTGMVTRVVATTSQETRIDYQICPSTHRSPGWC